MHAVEFNALEKSSNALEKSSYSEFENAHIDMFDRDRLGFLLSIMESIIHIVCVYGLMFMHVYVHVGISKHEGTSREHTCAMTFCKNEHAFIYIVIIKF